VSHETSGPRLGASPAQSGPSRLPSLTGARFIAAGMVFFFHATWQYFFSSPDAQKTSETLFTQGGWSGVTFFFVLSGFVLTWAVRPGDTAPTFWRRRFFKIYPNHLITFLAAFVLLSLVTKASLSGWDGLLNLLLLQGWHPDLAVRIGFNQVAWSLSCEALFYFAFPFLIKLIDKVRTERLWFWTILSAASVISIPTFARLLPAGQQFPDGFSTWELWFVFHFPPVQMLQFVFGMFLAKVVLTGQRLPLNLGGAVALTVGAYFVAPVFDPLYHFSAIAVVPLGLLIAAAATADVARVPTFLSRKTMVWLGDISFAFYMWHNLVLTYGHHWLGAGESWSTPVAVAAIAFLFGVTLVLSWATFTFIERPVMKRFANARRRRHNLKVVPATPPGTGTDRAA
jgi:peptidoglycan/LPS O-acetylase OafA/YrhL